MHQAKKLNSFFFLSCFFFFLALKLIVEIIHNEQHAGVTVGSERGSLLPGSGEKPADVYAHEVVARFVRLTVSATIGEAQATIRRSHAIQCSSLAAYRLGG